jgi:L-lactate dehydrogenase
MDLNESLTKAQTKDLKDSLMFSQFTTLTQVNQEDVPVDKLDVVIVTAGANQAPGETRMQLLAKNADLVKRIAGSLSGLKKEAIVLMVTNPVDVLTAVAREVFDLEPCKVIGSGTMLDSARLRWRIAERMGRCIHNVHGYVLGEHGDSEFVAWSSVSKACKISDEEKAKVEENVRGAAYEIIEGKGATFFGIGAAAVYILTAILHDSHALIPVSTHYPYLADEALQKIPLGVPSVIGDVGIVVTPELDLTEDEMEKLESSARQLHAAFESIA